MRHSVKGLTFSENELKNVHIKDLSGGSLSPAHLFLFVRQKPFLLLRAGDILEEGFLKKYREKGVASFKCLPVADQETVHEFRKALSEFKRLANEKEKLEFRDSFISLFADLYWKKSESSILDLLKACYDELYHLPPRASQKLEATSVILRSRAVFSGSVAVVTAIFESIVDYDFLRDLYNAAFLMDFGFVEGESFNYHLIRACELERKKPGSGLEYLEQSNRTEDEKRLFFNHPLKGEKLSQEYAECFSYPETLSFIRYQHEQLDGSGFPSGHAFSGLSRTETILSFSDRVAPFEEAVYQRFDGQEVLDAAFEDVKKRLNNTFDPCLQSWEAAKKWALDKIVSQYEMDESKSEAA